MSLFRVPSSHAEDKKVKPETSFDALIDRDSSTGQEPTYINSDSLSLDTEKKIFTYSGNVKVTQGDMTLSSDLLDGFYTENNEIKQLIAKKNVVITKKPDIKATSSKAVYDAEKQIITLTDNPQLQQGESLLSAELVTFFIRENRSIAEGEVRMKLMKSGEKLPDLSGKMSGTPTPGPSSTPTRTPKK